MVGGHVVMGVHGAVELTTSARSLLSPSRELGTGLGLERP